MNTAAVWTIFYILVGWNFFTYFISIIYSSLYDFKKAAATPHAGIHTILPKDLTILIPAYNEELVIERALKNVTSVVPSDVKIIVIDDRSRDLTSAIVKRFINEHPHPNITLMKLHFNQGKGGALNQALALVTTELVMVLDADCTLEKNAIGNLLPYFYNDSLQGIATHVRIASEKSLLAVLQKVEFIVGFNHKKYFDASGSEFIIGGQGSTYRTKTLLALGGYKQGMQTEDIEVSLGVVGTEAGDSKIAYADDVIVYTEAVPTIMGLFRQRYRWKFGAMQAVIHHKHLLFSRSKAHSKLLTWYRLPMLFAGELQALSDPIVILSFIYIATSTMNGWIFVGSWASFCIYTTSALLIDDFTSKKDKVALSFLLLPLYPFFLLFTAINFVAMIKVIGNWKSLFGFKKVSGSWISPERIGKHHLAG